MAKQEKEPKKKFILLSTAVRKYRTKEKNIQNWAKAHKITAARIGNTWFIDENSLYRYLEDNKTIQEGQEKIAEQIAEIKKYIARQEGLLLGLKTVENAFPILKVVIDELAKLIKNPVHREIFIDISLGKDINEIAKKYNFPLSKIHYIYNCISDRVLKRASIVQTFRDEVAALKRENYRQTILLKNKDKHISYLSAIAKKKQEFDDNIPDEIVDVLITPLKDFNLEYRTESALKAAGLKSLEDLLRFVNSWEGWEGLLKIRNFGKLSLRDLRGKLISENIIDLNGDSVYFRYLQ